jgi:NTP pyrophosphatase (non-canonical NTP hydrolase)
MINQKDCLSLNEFQSSIALTYRPGNIACHGLGIAGEAGEVADIIKKTLYHDEPLPLITHPRREAAREELGDVLWYVAAVASDWGLSLNDVAQGNIDKLRERYPNGFVRGGGVRDPKDERTLSYRREDDVQLPQMIAQQRERLRGHVCGLQGFGAIGDVCPACDAARHFHDVNPMSEKD